MDLTFEPASLGQRARIARTLRAAFTLYADEVGYALTGDEYAWLPNAIRTGRVHVARETRTVVGVIVTTRDGHDLEIDFLATDVARQGTGIGRWLLTQLEAKARRDGLAALTLHTAEIRQDLLDFYRRFGFVETHRALPAHGKDRNLRVHMRKVVS